LPKKFQTVKGMRDLLPLDFKKFKYVIKNAKELFDVYNYQEVNMPIVEYFELIAEKAGEEIRNTMYVFKDKADRTLALRPEMTASVARLYINNLMKIQPKPVKLSYIGQNYRYDQPQRGRYREFWQAGFEFIGSSNPVSDAEIITICCNLMKKLKFKKFIIKLGHVGVLKNILKQENIEESKQDMIFGLIDKGELTQVFEILNELKISKKCLELLKELFELKGNDLSNILARATELISNYEGALNSLRNLKELIKYCEDFGIAKFLNLDLGFARGLEYYTGMIFEIFTDLSIAIGGGGRYDHLIETFGGMSTPAVGCALGIDRILIAMDQNKLFSNIVLAPKKVLILPISETLIPEAIKISNKMRSLKKKYSVELETIRFNLKKAMKYADSQNFEYVVIVAPNELKENKFVFRNMKTAEQKTLKIENIIKILENN